MQLLHCVFPPAKSICKLSDLILKMSAQASTNQTLIFLTITVKIQLSSENNTSYGINMSERLFHRTTRLASRIREASEKSKENAHLGKEDHNLRNV